MTKIWLISFESNTLKTSEEEKEWSTKLPKLKKLKYLKSRSYLRFMISSILNISPLEVPLFSPPGLPPILKGRDLGYVGISYSFNYFAIAWSRNKIGIDIEKIDRSFHAKKITDKYFTDKENIFLQNYSSENYKKMVLKFWVSKEAAIKYSRGTLSRDIKKWELINNLSFIFNKNTNYQLPLKILNFYNHFIAIASKDISVQPPPLICFDKKNNLKII